MIEIHRLPRRWRMAFGTVCPARALVRVILRMAANTCPGWLSDRIIDTVASGATDASMATK